MTDGPTNRSLNKKREEEREKGEMETQSLQLEGNKQKTTGVSEMLSLSDDCSFMVGRTNMNYKV